MEAQVSFFNSLAKTKQNELSKQPSEFEAKEDGHNVDNQSLVAAAKSLLNQTAVMALKLCEFELTNREGREVLDDKEAEAVVVCVVH